MPGSCSSGFRSRPSAAAGSSRSNGFDVNSDEQQEADADQAHHAEHARDHARRGSWRLNSADRQRPAGEHQQSTAAASLRARPRSRRRGRPAAAASSSAARRRAPRNRCRRTRSVRQPKAIGDEHELRLRRRPRQRHPARRRRARAPTSGSTRLHQRDERARGSARTARARESSLASVQRLRCAASPCVRLLERVRGFGRHVVLVVLGQHFARA